MLQRLIRYSRNTQENDKGVEGVDLEKMVKEATKRNSPNFMIYRTI